jgi:hypothetical protein
MKRCKKCKRALPNRCFYRNRATCLYCYSVQRQEYYHDNWDKIAEKRAERGGIPMVDKMRKNK